MGKFVRKNSIGKNESLNKLKWVLWNDVNKWFIKFGYNKVIYKVEFITLNKQK